MLKRVAPTQPPSVSLVLSKVVNATCRLPLSLDHAWPLWQTMRRWRPQITAAVEADPHNAPPILCVPHDYATDVLLAKLGGEKEGGVENKGGIETDVSNWSIPLPDVMLSGKKGGEEYEPRVVAPLEAYGLTANSLPPLNPRTLPRDAESTMFFRREELVDNFLRGARILKAHNPFWISRAHPSLGGFLQLKKGMEGSAVRLSVTAMVFPLEHCGNVESATLQKFGILGGDVAQGKEKNYSCGRNAITQSHSSNPKFMEWAQSEKLSGQWVSLSQIAAHSLTVHGKSLTWETMEEIMGWGVRVELKELVVYNADQLQVPGRLHLKSSSGNFAGATTAGQGEAPPQAENA